MTNGIAGVIIDFRRFAVAKRIVVGALTLAAGATLFAATARAECQKEDFRIFLSGQPIWTHWRVQKSEICSLGFGSGYSGNVNDFAISQKPAHGGAGVVNQTDLHWFVYRAANGYLGKDHFQVTLRVNNARDNSSLPMTIDVDVEVVDKL